MRTRMKLFTVGLVLVTAAVAGCSSTTAGTDGAIQDDVELAAASSAAPSSSSAGPTSSPDPVASPTDSLSPTASPDDPVLLGSKPPTDVCDANLQYACGVIGQSGVGTVFYASSTAFPCGENAASSCHFLEMAPNMWNPNSSSTCKQETGTSCGGTLQTTSDFSATGKGFAWCTAYQGGGKIVGARGTGPGAGFDDTRAMVQVCNSGDAGNAARSYTGGGLTDWYLPSLAELSALYVYSGRAGVGGFNSGGYWSSTEAGLRNDIFSAYAVNFDTGQTAEVYRYDAFGVRPIRAW